MYSSFRRLYDDALATLGRLHILPSGTGKLALNATFKSAFRQAITGGSAPFSYFRISLSINVACRGTSGSFGVPAPPDDKRAPTDLDTLDAFALERWEVEPLSFFAAQIFDSPLVDNFTLHGLVGFWPGSNQTFAGRSISFTEEWFDGKSVWRMRFLVLSGLDRLFAVVLFCKLRQQASNFFSIRPMTNYGTCCCNTFVLLK